MICNKKFTVVLFILLSLLAIAPFAYSATSIRLNPSTEYIDIFGYLNMTSFRVVNMSDPIDDQDAATKAYVDATSGGSEGAGWSNSSGYVYLTTYTDEVNLTSLYVNNTNNRVGIMTKNPTQALHVVGSANFTGSLELSTGANVNEFSVDDTLGGDSDIAVPTEQAVKAYVDGKIAGGSEGAGWSNSSGYVYLTTYTDEVNLTSLYVNNTNGNVGIGTKNPLSKLQVIGDTNLNNTLYIDAVNDRVSIGLSTVAYTFAISNGTSNITFDLDAATPTINTSSTEDLIITAGTGNVIIQIG